MQIRVRNTFIEGISSSIDDEAQPLDLRRAKSEPLRPGARLADAEESPEEEDASDAAEEVEEEDDQPTTLARVVTEDRFESCTNWTWNRSGPLASQLCSEAPPSDQPAQLSRVITEERYPEYVAPAPAGEGHVVAAQPYLMMPVLTPVQVIPVEQMAAQPGQALPPPPPLNMAPERVKSEPTPPVPVQDVREAEAVATKAEEPPADLADAADTEPLPPLPPLGEMLSREISKNSGVCRTTWRVQEKKLRGLDKVLVSPVFQLTLGDRSANCKMAIFPISVNDKWGGGSFKKAKGTGKIELKCEEDLKGAATLVDFMMSVGEEKRGPVRHDFNEKSTCGLPQEQEKWDFKQHVTGGSFTVCIEVQPVQLPAEA